MRSTSVHTFLLSMYLLPELSLMVMSNRSGGWERGLAVCKGKRGEGRCWWALEDSGTRSSHTWKHNLKFETEREDWAPRMRVSYGECIHPTFVQAADHWRLLALVTIQKDLAAKVRRKNVVFICYAHFSHTRTFLSILPAMPYLVRYFLNYRNSLLSEAPTSVFTHLSPI